MIKKSSFLYITIIVSILPKAAFAHGSGYAYVAIWFFLLLLLPAIIIVIWQAVVKKIKSNHGHFSPFLRFIIPVIAYFITVYAIFGGGSIQFDLATTLLFSVAVYAFV